MKRKSLLIIGGIVLLFIITNPSASAFKEHQGKNSYSGLKRTLNLFILSEYKDHGEIFIGIAGNFLDITDSKRPKSDLYSLHADSAVMTDTSIHTDKNKQWSPPKGDIEVK